ncbi:MAG TPA: nucleotide pyrophosphohydrolase [Desulfotomaculum sp.]|nr:nucleotide pyrophosphohydrolase [Desulfotomaculum sp.]
MPDENTTVKQLRDLMAAFVFEREWEQFHTPKNLAMSIAIEAAELMELFQWADGKVPLEENKLAALRQELADVIIYCLALANVTGIDISGAVMEKIKMNAGKYPVDRYRGRYE